MVHVPTASAAHIPFDLAAWSAGAALSFALYRWRLKVIAERLATQVDAGYFAVLVLGALCGGWVTGSLNSLRGSAPALSHSVVGALAGAIVAVEIYKRLRGMKGSTGGVFVGPFSLGVVIGRLGCFFSGIADGTFGSPTTLPWSVDLGDGVGRHPVQIYESASMALFLVLYLRGLAVRAPWALRRGFYVMCAWYGAERFVWEFFKPYPPLLGPLNIFHILCLGLVAYGWLYYRRDRSADDIAQDRALPVPRSDHEPV